MGNVMNNCIDCGPDNDTARPKRGQNTSTNTSQLNYSDLPEIVKMQNINRHRKFKHGYIQRYTKASIYDQLRNEEAQLPDQLQYNIQLISSVPRLKEDNCGCAGDEYHRIISRENSPLQEQQKNSIPLDQSDESISLIDQMLAKESLLHIPLAKIMSSFPSMSEGSNTDISGSPTSKKSHTDGTLSVNEDDIPDFCQQCDHCSNTIQKVIEKTHQDEVVTSINRQISSFFLKKHIKCSDQNEKNHVHHTNQDHDNFEAEEIAKRRKTILEMKQKERQFNIFQRKEYKLTRREIICKVSVILNLMIIQFMEKVTCSNAKGVHCQLKKSQCVEIKQSSLLFNEGIYHIDGNKGRKLSHQSSFNFGKASSSIDSENLETSPSQKMIEQFITKILHKMKLTNEVCLLALIFIERLIQQGEVQILSFNWRPIIFTALLLAAKFWEDIIFWNIDFADGIKIYPLKSVNKLESTFLALCRYELYVSEDLYNQYYDTIVKKTTTAKEEKKHKKRKNENACCDDCHE